MKKMILVLLAGLCMSAKAQEASVEKSVTSIQTGLFGVWLQKEFKLARTIALRSEIGLDASNNGYIRESYYHGREFTVTPVLTLEPRFYLNLKRRALQSKNIEDNSGNFIALNLTSHPDWFTLPSKERLASTKSIFLTPMFGIRRNIGKHLHYEGAIGIGFGKMLDTDFFAPNFNHYYDYFIIRTPIRIGYRF